MENTNNNESLKGVRILRSYFEALDEFTYEEKGRMFEAIMEYGLNGTEPNFDNATDARALRGIWKTYLPVIDNSINRAIPFFPHIVAPVVSTYFKNSIALSFLIRSIASLSSFCMFSGIFMVNGR